MERIIFVDLKQGTNCQALGSNEIRVILGTKANRITFNTAVVTELAKKKHTHCKIGVGEDSGSVYLLFNNKEGIRVPCPFSKNHAWRCKAFMEFIMEHFKLSDKSYYLNISGNLAHTSDYSTYKVTLPVNKEEEEVPVKIKPEHKKKLQNKSKETENAPKGVAKDILKLDAEGMEDLGIKLSPRVKNTINKFGTLGDVFASDPADLIHRERGIGKDKVTQLQEIFTMLGLNWA